MNVIRELLADAGRPLGGWMPVIFFAFLSVSGPIVAIKYGLWPYPKQLAKPVGQIIGLSLMLILMLAGPSGHVDNNDG